MKLFVYDHCPYCNKARMICGLKDVDAFLVFLLNDDEKTPINMVGKKMVPILEKDDGEFMPESMDIVHYIDQNFEGSPIVSKSKNGKLLEWNDNISLIRYKLAMPRWTQVGLKEFATQSAVDYFTKKKEMYIGSFSENLANSNKYISEVNAELLKLESMLYSENTAEEELSDTDFDVFSTLHSLSIVKGINFPDKVMSYMKNMSKSSDVNLHLDIAI